MELDSKDKDVIALYKEEKWHDILSLNDNLNEVCKSKLSWIHPTINDLKWIDNIARYFNLKGITSIGCGTGLLEWLFQKYSGLNVVGIELDNSWWSSKYAPPIFLRNIIFVREDNTKKIILDEHHGLLFCYFNNPNAFCDYIQKYNGNLIIVIGPREGQYRTTDPMPFDIKFEKFGWQIHNSHDIINSHDCAVAYKRMYN